MMASLTLIVGPMFSGKTTELMRRLRRKAFAHKKILMIKFQEDMRYSREVDVMATHDRQTMKAVPALLLKDVAKDVEDVDVIGIDEGQFFMDLVDMVMQWLKEGKEVVVAALDGNYQQKPMGDVPALIPLCDRILKLNAVCMDCGADAPFTKRISACTDEKEIGGADKYKAVCRRCLHKL
jgi:thymidine kinase